MAALTNVKLTISHDHTKKLVTPVVTCTVRFSTLELCQMEQCARHRWFKLKCQLWGEDGFFTGADDYLWTYSDIYYFPDGNPTASEDRKFSVTVGEGVLDEDWGRDEVYGKLLLYNLATGAVGTRKTNVVKHYF